VDGKTLAGAVTLVAIAGLGVGMAALFASGPPPAPDRPRPPPPPEALMNGQLRYSPVVYRGQLEQDARTFGVPVPAATDVEAPFIYVEEVKEKRKLTPRTPIETAHLRLSLDIEKHEASMDGHRYRFEHLVLRLENRTGKYLAYRVLTDVAERRRCGNKGDIPHNAMVIEPNQTLRRTECLFRTQAAIDVNRVEVMELPHLPAIYVSRLPATGVLYDRRTSAGHVPLKGNLCPQTFSWREIQEGIEHKQIDWRDVVDFYARHNCDEYAFFRSYRFRTDAAAPLPARPQD
jgi:hypothetical protein